MSSLLGPPSLMLTPNITARRADSMSSKRKNYRFRHTLFGRPILIGVAAQARRS